MTYQKNWLEWTVLIISAFLVTLTLGVLVYEAMTLEETPPAITISLGMPSFQEGRYVIAVEAKNKGTQTAEDVRIEIVSGSGAEQERAEIEFPFLPGNARREGRVTLTKNPDSAALWRSRVLGYSIP